jgi:hypothetical protein
MTNHGPKGGGGGGGNDIFRLEPCSAAFRYPEAAVVKVDRARFPPFPSLGGKNRFIETQWYK